MKKQIRLNAFAMNCVAHQSPGLWTHPRDRTLDYNRLPYWLDLAKTLERGRFDGLFLADVLGVYDVFGNSPDAALRNAAQTPANEPLMLIPAMAAVTEHLGFGVTSNLSFEPPYPFARRMSTLDHLTEGRVGWNVVTGYLDSAARGAGKDKQTAHDDRYEIADEYMELVYKLWEGSWEDEAVLRDRARGVFADPSKVHRIAARGDQLQAQCDPPERAVAAADAGAVPGRHLAARTAIRGPACRMRVHVGPVGQDHRAARGGDPRGGQRDRAQPGRNPDVQHDDDHSRAHRGRGGGEIRRLSPPHQSRGRAGADVGLDRRRLLDLRPRPAGAPRPERRRPHRARQRHPRRSGPGLDRARSRRACRHRRRRAGRGRHAREGRRRHRGLVRADRRRRPQRCVRDLARRFRGYRRHAGAGVDAARAVQARVCGGHAAREAVRRGTRAADRAASGGAVSAACCGRRRRSRGEIYQPSLRDGAKQSIDPACCEMDCFVAIAPLRNRSPE